MRVPKHTRRTDVDRQIALSSSGGVSARAGVIRAGQNTRQHPQWWLFIALLTAICADQVCAVECSNLRLEPVFWITSRPRLACSNHCNHVDSLSWEEARALVFVENPNSARICQCGDEPDCGLRREADETADSLDNQESPLKRSAEDDPVKSVQ